jgi:hypothetical protein
MSNFIQTIVKYILSSEKQVAQFVFIVPSQRAQKYIQSALFKELQQPFFAPQFYTLSSWVKANTPSIILGKTAMLFELYKVHLAVSNEKQPFEAFSSWGELLINDFDEIDRYLVESKQIFCNLRDIKEIENWSFNSTEKLSENQKQFLQFWEHLEMYYQSFNAQLNKKGSTYMGAALKKMHENVAVIAEKLQDQELIFAGFNALSPAEMSIIKQLVNRKKAVCFAEADAFFYNDKSHEAGTFVRQLKKSIPETKLIITDLMRKNAKKIELIACSESTSQAKVAYAILDALPEEEKRQTLLLLADETLVVPCIKNLPASINEANITLGLPLKYTQLKTWVTLLFDIQEHFSYFNNTLAYHKDVDNLLNNAFFAMALNENDRKILYDWHQSIIQYNKIFTSVHNIQGISEEGKTMLSLIFKSWDKNWAKAIENILQINEMLFAKLNPESDLLERSALYQFDRSIRELLTLLLQDSPELAFSSFKHIFHRHWTNKSVAYYGNPNEGMQIMGLLESRMLSFKNILVVGLNEGAMPPTNPIQTIVPMDLRRYMGLPMPSDKEALFSHHFYRLLPEVESLWITYAEGESNSGKESSRFVKQIEYEWCKENPKIQLLKQNFQLPFSVVKQADEAFPQSQATQNKIKAYFSEGVSASSLNKFLICPQDFYYKHIIGLYEEDNVEEELASSSFGSFVHKVLEILFQPFLEKQVLASDIDKMLLAYTAILEAQFLEQFNNDKTAFRTGNNQLSFQIASYQLERYLHFERNNLFENPDKTLIINKLEHKFSHDIHLDFQGERIPLKIKGYADRIDSWGDEIRIVDYKTGKCEAKHLKYSITEENLVDFAQIREVLNKSKFSLQLSMYAYLYFQQFNHYPDTCSILSFTHLDSGYQVLEKQKYGWKDVVENTEQVVQQIALNMLLIEQFSHDVNAQYCNYCDVKKQF